MKFSDMRRVFDAFAPHVDGEYCVSAEHDVILIQLKEPASDELKAQVGDVGGLVWDSQEYGYDGLVVTIFP